MILIVYILDEPSEVDTTIFFTFSPGIKSNVPRPEIVAAESFATASILMVGVSLSTSTVYSNVHGSKSIGILPSFNVILSKNVSPTTPDFALILA